MIHPTTDSGADVTAGVTTGVTTGVLGQPWRATITPSGSIVPSAGLSADRRLDWWVAATDRWHTPSDEPAVRQIRIESTPVTETRLRVPNGDVVQRVYSVADDGGLTIVEFENESTLPVAVALSHRDVRTDRPIADVPIEGIELPAEAFVMPLGHRATVRIALSHTGSATGPVPDGASSLDAVVRGWLSTVERAGRYVFPDGDTLAEVASSLVAQRCEIALAPMPYPLDDPIGFLVGVDVRGRLGEPIDPWLDEVATAVAALGPDPSWRASAAFNAAERVLARTDETRAQRDLHRIIERRAVAVRPTTVPTIDDPTCGPWLDEFCASGGRLLADGLPESWRGQPVEAYQIPTGPHSSVSFALRWHGDNVALLWEQFGEPVELTAPALDPAWSTTASAGEALLRLDRR